MTDYLPLPGTPIEELDTPCILVDLDLAEANIAKLQSAAKDMGVHVRPHSKTSMSPYWCESNSTPERLVFVAQRLERPKSW